ncbi:HNH endonuclease [Neisseria sp. 74A18]|uniref:HNH endonuclease n=1 Tax=Neisseria sp. 74A18 TaxID=1696094 RepID=UPI0006CAC2AA|nr:HNH endonuclease [Neisseria sp. 74A18]
MAIKRQIIISEKDYIWKDLCLSVDGKSKRKDLKSWSFPELFKNHYQDGQQRLFCITFPEITCINPIIVELSISSGQNFHLKGNILKLCKQIADELGNQFYLVVQSLDIKKTCSKSTIQSTLPETIARIVKQRTRQAAYRNELLTLWNNKCALTNIDFKGVLVASHIKPFYLAEGSEKYDVANGLLLCTHIDKLFDLGLISFDENGSILVSQELANHKLLQKLNIPKQASLNFNNLSDPSKKREILAYLSFHRDKIFHS